MKKSIIKGFYKGLSFLFLMGIMFSIFNSEIEAWEDKQEDRSLSSEYAQYNTDDFIKALNKHFTTPTAMGDHRYFDDNRKASQAFQKECSNYANFRDSYFNHLQNKTGTTNSVNQIKESAESCSKTIVKKYLDVDRDSSVKIKIAFHLEFEEVYNVFHSANDSFPDNVQVLKKGLENWQSFKTKCISFIKDNTHGGGFEGGRSLPYDNLGKVLEGLYGECLKLRKQVVKFIESRTYKKFIGLPNTCGSGGGCVQALQERVSSNQNARTIFQVCREEQSQAEACCQTPLKCSYYPNTKSHYQALLGSESQAGSQKTEICQSNPASLANWANKTTEICFNSVDLCQESCQKELTAFREEFLQCFFLPDLQKNSLGPHGLHGKNACGQKISNIDKEFKRLAQNFKQPNDFNSPLTNLKLSSLDNLESSSHAIARNCKKPLQDLKTHSQARAKAVYGELCGEFLAKKGSNQGTGGVVNPSTLSSSSANVSSSGGRNTQGSFSGRDQSGSSFARDGGSSRSINGGARGEGERLTDNRGISGGREFLLGRGREKEEDIRAEFADGKDPIMNPFGEDKEFYPTRAFFNRKKWGVISDEQLEMEKKFEELLKREGFESEDDYKEYYNIVEKEKEEIAQAEGPLSKAVAYAKGKGRRMMSFVKRKAREAYNARYGDPREKRRLLKWWNELPGPEVDLMEEQKRLLLMFCRERNTCKKWGWETEEEEEDETLKSPATQPPATQPPATQPPATQPPATQPPATQPVQPPATVPSSGP